MDMFQVLSTIEKLCLACGKMEAIIESSMNAVLEVDKSGNVISYNPAFVRMFDIDISSTEIMNINDIFIPENGLHVTEYLDPKNEVILNTVKTVIQDSKKLSHEKYFEYKIISIPTMEKQSYVVIISDKSEVITALENRENYIETLFNLIEELKVDNKNTIYHLAKLVELRDSTTGKHLERVEQYTRILASEYKDRFFERDNRLTDDYIEDMAISSVLHDIGKIGISDIIINKSGSLTSGEYEVIKQHTLIASEALIAHKGKKDFLAMGREIALTHHEKWDGTGYPNGLKGDMIPLSGRIVSLCDVYDALVSERSYKDAMTHEEAVKIIRESGSSSFDPEIVDCFLYVEEKFREIRSRNR